MGHARSHERRSARRIKRPMRDVIRAGIAQVNRDGAIDALDVDELGLIVALFAERGTRNEKTQQQNVPEKSSDAHD
jgi:hypothetical protein